MIAGAPSPSHFWRHLLAVFALTLTVTVVYLNSFNGAWTSEAREAMWDDPGVSAARLRDLRPLLGPASGTTAPHWEQALPRFSYWANRVAFGGSEPFGAHATNFALHWLNCVLLYAAMLAVLRNPWGAYFVAALFGVHPLATDAVSNIAGRPELLAAGAVIAGLLCAARSVETRGARRFFWLLLIALAQFVGLLSHDIAWALPLVLICFHLSSGAASKRTLGQLGTSLAFVLLPAAGAASLIFHQRSQHAVRFVEDAAALNPLLSLDAIHARLTALKVLGRSLALMLWPETLLPDYSANTITLVTPPSYISEGWKVALVLIVVALLLVIAFRARGRNQPLLFFTLLFFATWLPVSNLVGLTRTILLERDLYLPTAAFAGWLVSIVYALARSFVPRLARYDLRRQEWPSLVARSVLIVMVVAFGARTFLRNFDWQSDETLWSAAVTNAPNDYRAHLRLASALLMKEPKDLAGAVREGERALALTQEPNWPESHPPRELLLRLGTAYRFMGDSSAPRADARANRTPVANSEWYQKSVTALEGAAAVDQTLQTRFPQRPLRLRLPAIYWNLGLSYTQLERAEEALRAFQNLARNAPANPDAYIRLAAACATLNRAEEGATACSQALVLDEKRKEPFDILTQLYKEKGTDVCAVSTPGGTVRVNVRCEVLQSYLPAAYRGLIENFLGIDDRKSALRLKEEAATKYQFPPETFDALFGGAPAPAG